MSFEKDDAVVLHDKHSEFDGETGTITQVMETMFGDPTYTVSFDDGQETGVPEDQLEAAEGDVGSEAGEDVAVEGADAEAGDVKEADSDADADEE